MPNHRKASSAPLVRRRTTRFPSLPLPAAVRKELMLLRRVSSTRTSIVLVCGIAALTAVTQSPLLLIAIIIPWLALSINLLGPDLPLGGITRYVLMTVSLRCVLIWRHVAILSLTVVTAAFTLFILIVLGQLLGIRLHTPAAFLPHLGAALLYAVSTYALFIIPGEYFSVRYPQPITRRRSRFGVGNAGRASTSVRVLGAWSLAVICMCIVLAGSQSVVARIPWPRVWRGSTDTLMFISAALVQASIYAGYRIMRGHRESA